MDRQRRTAERNLNFTKDMPEYWVHKMRAGDLRLKYIHHNFYQVIKGEVLLVRLLDQVATSQEGGLYFTRKGDGRESFCSLYGDCLHLYNRDDELPPLLQAIFGK